MTKFFCLTENVKEKLSILFLSVLKTFISSACMLDFASSRDNDPILRIRATPVLLCFIKPILGNRYGPGVIP